jgi:hypothetical protein
MIDIYIDGATFANTRLAGDGDVAHIGIRAVPGNGLEMGMKQFLTRKPALACLVGAALVMGSGAGHAAPTYVFDTTSTSNIPGLTGFSTTGAMMSGMSVTVRFVGGGSETKSWGTTDMVSGGASGTGWSLSQSGDTFVGIDQAVQGLWRFSNTSTQNVQSLTLDGNPGLTLFDIDTYDTCQIAGSIEDNCTDGSARGARMRLTNGALAPRITYSDLVGIAGNGGLGDLFHTVSLDFGANGISGNFAFDQDTDNDSRFNQTPEPGSIALVALALCGLARVRRRQA